MKNFIKINKGLLLAFWLAFVVNVFMPLGDWATHWVMGIGLLMLLVHALELAAVFKRLKRIGHATPVDFIWIMLLGLLHWKPLLRKQTIQG